MAVFTGNDLYKLFEQSVGLAYTGYFDPPKAQRFLQRAYIGVCENMYDKDDSQRTRDNLSYIITTNRAFNINNNQLYVAPLKINGVIIIATTTAQYFTTLPHNLVVGQTVLVTGVQGFTPNPNGSYVVATIPTANSFTVTPILPATGTYVANTGEVTCAEMVSDYWHLLAIDAKFQRQIYDFNVSTISNATPCVVDFNFYNNISTGEYITISGATGNTAANGTWYFKKLNEFQAALYQDKYFQVPVVGNGAYSGGAKLTRTWYNFCKPYESDVKIGKLNTPTITDPKFEIADNLIKIWPLNETCLEVTIDYMHKPLVEINLTDTVINLLDYYPQIFLNEIAADMQVQAAAALRDPESYQTSQVQKVKEGGQ